MRDSEWIKGEDSIKTQLSTVIQHSLCTFQLAKSSYLTNWSLIIFLSQPTHLFHRKGETPKWVSGLWFWSNWVWQQICLNSQETDDFHIVYVSPGTKFFCCHLHLNHKFSDHCLSLFISLHLNATRIQAHRRLLFSAWGVLALPVYLKKLLRTHIVTHSGELLFRRHHWQSGRYFARGILERTPSLDMDSRCNTSRIRTPN